jgi:hypothetical protein
MGSAQEGLLDGKVFVGQYTENHINDVKEDELSFENSEFHSIAYARRGFTGGPYRSVAKQDKIYFEVETVSPKQGTIKWQGVVQGDAIKVNYIWRKKGWLADSVRDYSFEGSLKN